MRIKRIPVQIYSTVNLVLYVRMSLSIDYFPSYRIRFGRRACDREQRLQRVHITQALAPKRARDFRAREVLLRGSIIIMVILRHFASYLQAAKWYLHEAHYLAKYTSFVLSPPFSYSISLASMFVRLVCTARFYLNALLRKRRLFQLAVTSLFSPVHMLKAFERLAACFSIFPLVCCEKTVVFARSK